MGNQIMTDENRKQYLLLAILYFFFAFFGLFMGASGFVYGLLVGLKYDSSVLSQISKVLVKATYVILIFGIITNLLTIKFFHRQYNFRKLDAWYYLIIIMSIVSIVSGVVSISLDPEYMRANSYMMLFSGVLSGFVMIMLGISLKKIKARLYGYKSLLVYTFIITGVLYAIPCMIILGIPANFINNIALGLMFWAASKGPDTLIEDNPPQVEAVTPQ